MKNVLSVDLEDWHPLIYRKVAGGPLPPPTSNVLRQLDRLLGLLSDHDTKATFFALGSLAEHYPDVVRRVAAEGHEVASHGYDHLLVHTLSPEAFREDTRRSKALLEDLIGEPVRGYRAAEFSVRERALWALDVLAELGFAYDSSVFPIRHRRYGIAGFAPEPRRYGLGGGRSIVEFPLSTVAWGRSRLPVAGGGYFRYLPAGLLRRAVARANKAGEPFVTYLHPYEFDSRRLDIFELLRPASWRERLGGLRFNVHQNIGRASMIEKVGTLIGAFPFTTFRDYLQSEAVPEGALPLSVEGAPTA